MIHECEHYHFMTWGSESTPRSATLPDLLNLVRNCAKFVSDAYESLQENYQTGKSNPAKLLVHCHEGTGRTGTFIALVNMYIQLTAQKKCKTMQLSPFSIVRRLREQRMSLVSDYKQYGFLYKFLKHFINRQM